ncbi:hypothetical protein [Kitasatospora sp. NPDC093558]|uniref:hypothetical protein n=1 Tax=Kitasatospora sp. NPDC093558 TaxID=3155201 RepID=UPI00343B8DA2
MTPATSHAPSHAPSPPQPADGSPGLIERFAELEPGLLAMSQDMTAMTTLVTTIAEAAERFGPGMQRAARDGSPMSAQLAVTQRLATALGAPAAELKESAHRFTERMAGLDATVHAALDLFGKVPPALWGPDDRGFLGQLVGISAAARHGTETLALFRTIVDVMIAMHRELRGPAGDIATAVARLADAMTMVEAWDHRARQLAA